VVRHVYLALAGANHAPPTLTGVCGGDPGIACRLAWDLSHSVRAAQVTESFLAGPIHLALKLVFVIVLALLIRSATHLVINRVTERAAEALLPQLRSSLPSGRLVPARLRRRQRPRSDPGHAAKADAAPASASADDGAGPGGTGHDGLLPASASGDAASLDAASADITSPGAASSRAASAQAAGEHAAGEHAAAHPHATSHPHVSGHHHAVTPQEAAAAAERVMIAERRHQRVRALGSILRSAASVTIFSIAGAVILGDLGINLAPLLASAGVVGIAIGFGAQNLVRDYLTGIFMLLEDQYGVGDVISVGDATGTVETVTLRITRLRDINGIVWHIRNGTIDQVGNQSQGWARAVIDFPVPYTADLATIRTILDGVAEAAWTDPALRGVMLEKPDVWGAQDVSSSKVTMRIVVRTAPLRQWEIERELRARVKAALDAAGIYPDPEPSAVPAERVPQRRHSTAGS
jgi:small-conductance mechanosensitive channel